MQQKFLTGVSAAFFLDVSQQSNTEHGSGHEMKDVFYIIVSARRQINILKTMKEKIFTQQIQAGSRKSHEPRLVGSIIIEMLGSNELFNGKNRQDE